MNLINIITLSAWVRRSGFWMAYSRKCHRSNELCSCSGYILSWQIHPWKSNWHAHQKRLRHSPTDLETDNTYMSNSAAIRRSREFSMFSSVWCHICMSKYLTRKGHRQTISFIEISIEAGILLGGKHEACFVLGVAGIEPMPSWPNWPGHRFRLAPTWLRGR